MGTSQKTGQVVDRTGIGTGPKNKPENKPENGPENGPEKGQRDGQRGRCFYLSINAIPAERIEEGVRILAETIRELTSGYMETLDRAEGELLDGTTLRDRMSGLNILGINSLGEPYEITLHPDGTMTGIANRGTPAEEKDDGIWYVKGDFWVRKWNNWSYGRESASRVVIRGSEIKWFRESGRLLDNAVIFQPTEPADSA